jgi:hypothetical protein
MQLYRRDTVLSDGATWEVSYEEAESMDFRSILTPL